MWPNNGTQEEDTMKIRNLRRYGKGDAYQLKNRISGETLVGVHSHPGGWVWEIVDDDGTITGYSTDKDGDGLWCGGKQFIGTCQYRAAKTYSGQRRKILRDIEILEEESI